MGVLKIKEKAHWDLVALGEVMLRLDPGAARIRTAREFKVWEGGGEYNVARGLKKCFGLSTAVATALPDNEVGHLVEDLMMQGGVDLSLLRWLPFDGVGRESRVGLNFTERGFGLRNAVGVSDRGHSAVSKLKKGDIDWKSIFEKTRWFHTGGIFAALSETAPELALEAMDAARAAGTIVSYDLNYRPSLWKSVGGPAKAREVNTRLVEKVDVLFGNEEDFSAALGFETEGVGKDFCALDPAAFEKTVRKVSTRFPNLAVIATTLRHARSATVNDWGALAFSKAGVGAVVRAKQRDGLEIFDRVGGGDSFAAGLIYGMLSGKNIQEAVDYGAAHGALAMTTPGDTSMVTLKDVERLLQESTARVER